MISYLNTSGVFFCRLQEAGALIARARNRALSALLAKKYNNFRIVTILEASGWGAAL